MAASETEGATWSSPLPGGATISVLVAIAIVVADMVGVGVFTSLGFQVKDIPSGFSILLLWTVGGIVALCGVFSYGELGAMFPRSSGEYNFLGRAYHPAFGFVAGWVSATVGFAAPVALAAMAFGEYGRSILPNAPPLLVAIGVVWLVSIVQLTGVRHSSTFQLIATILKVVLIVAFLVAGFAIAKPQPVSFAPSLSDLSHVASAPFAISLVFVMYSFSGWVSATVGFAAPVALAAMAFGEYGRSILPNAPPLLLAIGVVWLVSIVQLTGVRHSSTFQLIATILKVVLIVAFLVAGFAIAKPQPVSFAPSLSDLSHVASAPFAISLVFVMYSFSGWNAATYIIGEIRLPERNLPRAMLAGTLIVLVLYVALNAVFLYTAPIDKLAGQLDVARISGSYIFGEVGGRIVGAMICFGLISSISAMMWIGPRVMMTMGEDIPALRLFARRSTRGAPVYAILFQLMVASLMLFTRSFEAVLDFIQFALLFCSFFAVAGVIKLRITRPDLPRPYRAWGYPITPVVFLLVTAFMMYYLLTERPLQSALGTLIMLSGLLIYAIFRKRADRPATASAPGRQ